MTRTKNEPILVKGDRFDDTQSVRPLSELYDKLCRPIDKDFRSIANSPGLGASSDTTRNSGENKIESGAKRFITGQSVDPINGFIESRCHAFYRMLGLPVVSRDGFYNSGHDPDSGSTLSTRTTVNDSLSNNNPEVLDLASLRESSALERRRVFSLQNDVSIGYALLMKNPKRFLVAETGKDPFYFDKQTQPIAGRKEYVQNLKVSDEVKSSILRVAESPSHIIKPFIVIPAIEEAVTPNYKRRVCVPFLKDTFSTRTTTDVYLKRPIIEYILRQRLKTTERDSAFLSAANKLINNSSNTSDQTNLQIRNTLLALSGENMVSNLDSNIIDSINGFTSVESSAAIAFTRTIQSVIIELYQNIKKYNEISVIYNIQPVPSVFGPEFGGSILTDGGIRSSSQSAQKRATLELNRVISEFNGRERSSIGNEDVYATITVADLTKDFNVSIKKLKNEEERAGANAISALKAIEVITGEISGFGIIDILAFYTALWTINIEDLIGLLDNNSLSRLSENFGELAPAGSEVRRQLNSSNRSSNIFEVMTRLENRIFNILDYSDGVLKITREGPRRARKGNL